MFLLGIFKKKGIDISGCSIGATVAFGRYFQNEKGNKLEPIEWLVLDKNENECLLLSKYCLDTIGYCGPYCEHKNCENLKWENSYLRNWLNQHFYNNAFTEKEKTRILNTVIITDKNVINKNVINNIGETPKHNNFVFVLAKEECEKYLPTSEDRQALPTPYAVMKGARVDMVPTGKACWWLLPYIDMSGGTPSRIDYPQAVFQNGEIQYHSRNVGHIDFTVRPAIRIKV